jgi:hypothetical protein
MKRLRPSQIRTPVGPGNIGALAFVLLLLSLDLTACGSASTEAPAQQAEVSAPQETSGSDKAATASVSQGQLQAWIKTINLTPSLPNKDQVLTALVDWQPQGVPGLAVSYRWFVNGIEVTTGYRSDLSLATFHSGDRVYVVATIFRPDGSLTASQQSRSVVIQNRPPMLQSAFEGFVKHENELVGHIRYSDPDGDKVTVKLLGGPPGLTVETDGTLHWPLSTVQAGNHQLNVELTDEAGLGYRGTMTFSVEAGG